MDASKERGDEMAEKAAGAAPIDDGPAAPEPRLGKARRVPGASGHPSDRSCVWDLYTHGTRPTHRLTTLRTDPSNPSHI